MGEAFNIGSIGLFHLAPDMGKITNHQTFVPIDRGKLWQPFLAISRGTNAERFFGSCALQITDQ